MKYLRLLYVQVLIGIAAGIIAGWQFPAISETARLISETFINMIRMVIAPVIFLTIVSGIAGAGDMKKLGRVGFKSLLYFEIVTTLALIIGLVTANLLKPGVGVPKPSSTPTAQVSEYAQKAHDINWAEFFTHIVPSNIVDSFAKGDILQVLFFSILFGIGLKMLGNAGNGLLVTFDTINKILFNILKMIMRLSPIGAFGGMAYTIGKFGFSTLIVLGKLLFAFYLTGALFIFVVLHLVCRYYKINLWKLLVYIKEEILIILGASSSEAVLPSIMQKLTAAGCDKEVVGLVIPAGYSFNLDGSTIYLSMGVIFLAQAYNVDLSLSQQLTVIGILLLTSKGAAAVTGSGFIVLASTLSALKIIPLESLALLIGVDRFMSEGRAIINFIGNTIATLVIAKSEKALDTATYQRVVNKKVMVVSPPAAEEPSTYFLKRSS